MDLDFEDLSVVREDHQRIMRRCDEEMLDEILVVRLSADHAFAAALLRTVFGDRRALDEAEVGDGDDAALVGDDVLHPELAGEGLDLGAAGRGVLRLHLEELGLDQGHELVTMGDLHGSWLATGQLDKIATEPFSYGTVANRSGELMVQMHS